MSKQNSRYVVTLQMITDKEYIVEANNEEDAIIKAEDAVNEYIDDCIHYRTMSVDKL